MIYMNPGCQKKVKKLLNKRFLLMVGSVGGAKTKVTLPLLAAEGIAAVGFLSAAELLRTGKGAF